MILYVILLHLWGDHEYTKEQFQWSDVYSKQIGEDEVICSKKGDLRGEAGFDDTFYYFRYERKIWDGTVVGLLIFV